MYAIVEIGGRQYRVSPGDDLYVEKLEAQPGSTLTLPTLLVSDASGVVVGRPYVEGRVISATVVGNVKGEKLVVFKYHPKKRYRRKQGHRQQYTHLKVAPEGASAQAAPPQEEAQTQENAQQEA